MPQNKEYWAKRSKSDRKLDWHGEQSDWIDGYLRSLNHPHRQLIVEELERFEPFGSVLEIGSSCGPNLYRIKMAFPDTEITGIDINKDSINLARKIFGSEGRFELGDITKMPFSDKSFDVVLADAVLMYIDDLLIQQVLSEMQRVSKKGIIIVDWYFRSKQAVIKDFHWARNYQKLLKDCGYKTYRIKITKELWPTRSWSKNGYLFVARVV